MGKNRLVAAYLYSIEAKVNLTEWVVFPCRKARVVVGLYIVCADHHNSILQKVFVLKQRTTMESL